MAQIIFPNKNDTLTVKALSQSNLNTQTSTIAVFSIIFSCCLWSTSSIGDIPQPSPKIATSIFVVLTWEYHICSYMSISGPEKVIWFLPARKSIVLAYSQQQEKLRKLLQKNGLGYSSVILWLSGPINHLECLSSKSTGTKVFYLALDLGSLPFHSTKQWWLLYYALN